MRWLVCLLCVCSLPLTQIGCGSPGDSNGNNSNQSNNNNSNTEPPKLVKPTSNPKTLAQDCNVLAPDVCFLPFPSSVFTPADDSTPTGLVMKWSAKADFGDVWARLKEFKHDGFSTINPISTVLPGGIDPTSLPQTYEESLAEDASILVVNADATSPQLGERVPFQAKVVTSEDKKIDLLVITPLKMMAHKSRYAVIVTTRVRNREKTAHAPSDIMKELLGDFPPEGERKAWWEYYRGLHWLAKEKLKLSASQIVQMWDFHTRSKESTTTDILYMAKWTQNWLKENKPEPKIEETTDDKVFWRYTFSFKLPIWTEKEGSYPKRDSEGNVKINRVDTVKGELLVPKTATKDKPVELIIYGHGLGSGRSTALSRLREMVSIRSETFAAAVMDWDIHGERGNGITEFLKIAGAMNVLRFAAMLQQSTVDNLVLTRTLEVLLEDPKFKGIVKPPRFYVGQSLGGFIGANAAVVNPTLEAFVLNVTGMGMGNIMRLGVIANDFGLRELLKSLFENKTASGLPVDLSVELALQSSQIGLDPGDPGTLAPYVLKDRFESIRSKVPSILLQQSMGDAIVPNFSTNTLARSMGLPVVLPVVETIPGLETVQAPTQGSPASGLTQFRVDANGIEAHNALNQEALRLQVLDYFSSFLNSSGTPGNISYTCNGKNKTCDYLE
ncbi:MAG: hypothetical protein EP343_02180 [Deltaproteobacteria bacterium]|nr:MAG: hypothetical protein EP343_02180 [Deltaproteobacteria bacterium]